MTKKEKVKMKEKLSNENNETIDKQTFVEKNDNEKSNGNEVKSDSKESKKSTKKKSSSKKDSHSKKDSYSKKTPKEIAKELEILNSKIEELEKEKNELKEMLQRKAAEFENYKRRTEKEQEVLLKYASEPFILKMLKIYTDLEKTVSHFGENENIENIKQGVILIFNNFKKAFEEMDVKKIEAEGKEFDFNLHDALMQQPSTNVPENTILQVVEQGYTFKDKVIKHAKVIVSKAVE